MCCISTNHHNRTIYSTHTGHHETSATHLRSVSTSEDETTPIFSADCTNANCAALMAFGNSVRLTQNAGDWGTKTLTLAMVQHVFQPFCLASKKAVIAANKQVMQECTFLTTGSARASIVAYKQACTDLKDLSILDVLCSNTLHIGNAGLGVVTAEQQIAQGIQAATGTPVGPHMMQMSAPFFKTILNLIHEMFIVLGCNKKVGFAPWPANLM